MFCVVKYVVKCDDAAGFGHSVDMQAKSWVRPYTRLEVSLKGSCVFLSLAVTKAILTS